MTEAEGMVERVARALAVADGQNPEHLRVVGALRAHAGTGSDEWAGCLARARAAIAAMRVPTMEMTEAALHDYAEKSPFESPFGPEGSYACAWRAMIDAALTETDGREE